MTTFLRYVLIVLFLIWILPHLLTRQLVARAEDRRVRETYAATSLRSKFLFHAAAKLLPEFRPLFVCARLSVLFGWLLLAALVVLFCVCQTGALSAYAFSQDCTLFGTVSALVGAVPVILYRALLAKHKR